MNRPVLIAVYSVVLLIFVCLSFLFSSADMAYGSVDVLRLEKASNEHPKQKKYAIARKLSSEYDKTISTILFMNDTVNAGLDSVASLLGVNLCYLVLTEDAANVSAVAETWGLVASLIVLVLKIAFGEIVPKSVSKIKNYSMSVAYAKLMQVLIYIFTPITYPVSLLGGLLSRLFKKNVPEVSVGEDDLHEMIDDIEEHGQVDEDKADMLHDTIKYTHTEANEIMTPRVDLYALDIDDPIEDVIADPQLFKHSRVPVYQDTIDNIIGFVRTKDLMLKILKHEDIDLHEFLREPLRFPQSAEINDILRAFKKTRKHFALVIDEYGGLDGVITMEDVLEDIVGEIWDEKDRPLNPIVERKDGSYIIDGNVTLEDFCDLFGLDFEKIDTEYLTIGGFIIELLDDKFARVNDEMDFEGVHIKVIAVDDTGTVDRIIAKKTKTEEE
jgi:putative hemolysin